MGIESWGTTEAVLVPSSPKRKKVIVTNEDSGDEVIRVTDQSGQASGGTPIYNRDTLIVSGEMAKRELYRISDTATTAVSVQEVY